MGENCLHLGYAVEDERGHVGTTGVGGDRPDVTRDLEEDRRRTEWTDEEEIYEWGNSYIS